MRTIQEETQKVDSERGHSELSVRFSRNRSLIEVPSLMHRTAAAINLATETSDNAEMALV